MRDFIDALIIVGVVFVAVGAFFDILWR